MVVVAVCLIIYGVGASRNSGWQFGAVFFVLKTIEHNTAFRLSSGDKYLSLTVICESADGCGRRDDANRSIGRLHTERHSTGTSVVANTIDGGGVFSYLNDFLWPCDGEMFALGERLLSVILDVGHLHRRCQLFSCIGERRDVDFHPRCVGDVTLEVDNSADGDILIWHSKLIIMVSGSLGLSDSYVISLVGHLVSLLAVTFWRRVVKRQEHIFICGKIRFVTISVSCFRQRA